MSTLPGLSGRQLLPVTEEQQGWALELGRTPWYRQKGCPHGARVRGYLVASNGRAQACVFCWACGKKLDHVRTADREPVPDLCFKRARVTSLPDLYGTRGEVENFTTSTGVHLKGRKVLTVLDEEMVERKYNAMPERAFQDLLALQVNGWTEVTVGPGHRADVVTVGVVYEVKAHRLYTGSGTFGDRWSMKCQLEGYLQHLSGMTGVMAVGGLACRHEIFEHAERLDRSDISLVWCDAFGRFHRVHDEESADYVAEMLYAYVPTRYSWQCHNGTTHRGPRT